MDNFFAFLGILWIAAGLCGYALSRNWYRYQGKLTNKMALITFPFVIFGPMFLVYMIDFIGKENRKFYQQK